MSNKDSAADYESPLRRALNKAQDVDVEAGINFLNAATKQASAASEEVPEQVWLTVFTDDQEPRCLMANWRTPTVRNTQGGDYVATRPHHKVEYARVRASVDEPCKWCQDRIAGNLNKTVDEASVRQAAEKVVEHLTPHRLEWARHYLKGTPVEGKPGKDVIEGLAEIITTELQKEK